MGDGRSVDEFGRVRRQDEPRSHPRDERGRSPVRRAAAPAVTPAAFFAEHHKAEWYVAILSV